MINRGASIVIFFAALFGAGTVISEIQPFAAVPVLREKFAWYAAHADEYDTLFIGTSRVYRGIKPSVFDDLTAAAGVPTHSFNLGADAMSPPEDAYVLERIAALKPKRLRWVFIETGTITAGVGYGGDENVRSLHWHDTTRTYIALRALLAPPESPQGRKAISAGSRGEGEPVERAIAHFHLWFKRTTNAGRGAVLLRKQLAPPPRVHLTAVLGKKRDGYIATSTGPMTETIRADYERRMREPSRISMVDRHTQHSLDGMLRCLAKLGARPILVIPPTVGMSRQYPQAGCNAPVFDYGEVEKWPDFYQIDHRADRSHLNAAGAEVFTRAVAADFIELAPTVP